MELKQIEYFLQLAQMQHVSQAADFLNISQPTLSKSLSNLEKDLGVPLFDRVGNRLRLNASGQRFYEKAKQAMQILNTASLAAKRSVYDISGSISIICLTFAPILLKCIKEYMELNPFVNIQLLQYNHVLNRTADADYDFILSAAEDSAENSDNNQFWVNQPLFSEDLFFVIGPKHPQFSLLKEDEDSIDLAQFADSNFVTMQLDNNFVDFSYKICQSAGFFLKSFFQTDDFLIKMNMIREGMGVSFLPESCLDNAALLCPGLRAFRETTLNSRRTVIMTRKKKSLLNEASLDFWDFLMDYYNLPPDSRE